MTLISIKKLQKFNPDEAATFFKKPFKQLLMKDAKKGAQPKETFILGHLKSFSEKSIFKDLEDIIKCQFIEVSDSGEHSNFDAWFFGPFADEIEEHMKKYSNSCDIWAIFTGAHLDRYSGFEKRWSPFTVKLYRKKDVVDINLIMVHVKRPFLIEPYSFLSEIKHGGRYDVFVVVKEIIKNTKVLANGNRHTILALVDPSSLSGSSQIGDLLLHVFFNEPRECFPEPILPEDILRIRNVLGDFYRKDNKMHGKIYSASSVVKFKFSEDDVVTPVTSNAKYTMPAGDEELARKYKKWWEEVSEDVLHARIVASSQEENRPLNPAETVLSQIKDLTQNGFYNLLCLVVDVRVVPLHEVVVLRIKDGTSSNVFTTVVDLGNATCDLMSQTEKAIGPNDEIDVIVNGPAYNFATKLKPGVLVYLIRLKFQNIGSNAADGSVAFDALMEEGSSIFEPYRQSREARQLRQRLRLLKEKTDDIPVNHEQSVAQNSLNTISESTTGQNNCDGIKSPKSSSSGNSSLDTSSVKRLKTTDNVMKLHSSTPERKSSAKPPISSARNAREESTTSKSTPTNSLHTSTVKRSKNSSQSAKKLFPSPPQRRTTSKVVSPTVETRQSARSHNSPKSSKKSQSVPNNQSIDIQSSKNSEATYSVFKDDIDICFSDDHPLENSQDSEHSANSSSNKSSFLRKSQRKLPSRKIEYLHTECGPYESTVLTDFLRSSDGEKRIIWAKIEAFRSFSENKCAICNDLICFHACVWGFCRLCGKFMSSKLLRDTYSVELGKKSKIPCASCTSTQDGLRKSARNKSSNVQFLIPVMRLQFDLVDASGTEVEARLNGDQAELFFGTKPSFAWIVGDAPKPLQENVQDLVTSSHVRPFRFCLEKVAVKDQAEIIRITETKLISKHPSS